jgi:hypothetical protein
MAEIAPVVRPATSAAADAAQHAVQADDILSAKRSQPALPNTLVRHCTVCLTADQHGWNIAVDFFRAGCRPRTLARRVDADEALRVAVSEAARLGCGIRIVRSAGDVQSIEKDAVMTMILGASC